MWGYRAKSISDKRTVPLVTRRKYKKMIANTKGKGDRVPYKPAKFVTGCPNCEWVKDPVTKYFGPVQIVVSGKSGSEQVSCKNKHEWTVS